MTSNDASPTSTPQSPNPDPDDSPYTKTYIAIDGLDPNEITKREENSIEGRLLSLIMGTLGKAIDGVRVIRPEDAHVIEHRHDE